MLERLARRLAGSVLIWDLLLTMMCLRVASSVRLWLEYGNPIQPEQVQLPWQIYLAVAAIWVIIFLLITPQRAIFSSGLIEAIGRLIAAVALASLVFAGLLYLSFRDVSRLLFIYFAAGDLATAFSAPVDCPDWPAFSSAPHPVWAVIRKAPTAHSARNLPEPIQPPCKSLRRL